MWTKSVVFFVTFSCITLNRGQFLGCEDDPTSDPDDGSVDDLQFTWLGALQYIHVKNGTPHFFRVPRVVLISKQFVLSTAVDASEVPDGYALGNVVFGEYERDEEECGVTITQLSAGAQCEPSVLLMPIADVLIHPEYKHFGAKNSLALLKLLKPIKSRPHLTAVIDSIRLIVLCIYLDQLLTLSIFSAYKYSGVKKKLFLSKLNDSNYMTPACLPFNDLLRSKSVMQTQSKLFHIDYVNDVPRDFIEEEKEVINIRLLPRELCYLYDYPQNATHFSKHRMACTTGCGFHSGAPTAMHEHTGHWSIVSLAVGGAPCPDPLRPRRPPPPPRHILLHPYVPWITAAISGKAIGGFSKDDPFGYAMPRQSPYDLVGHAWVGHWWMGGIRCYDRGEAADDIFKFYDEIFRVKPTYTTYLKYYLEVDAAQGTMIICVKVGMPYRLGQPKVWDLDSPVVKIQVPLIRFEHSYQFAVEAWGYNVTESEASSESEEEECPEEEASDCSV